MMLRSQIRIITISFFRKLLHYGCLLINIQQNILQIAQPISPNFLGII